MLKIETKNAAGQLILQVQGRLAGACVPELRRCWESARAEQPEGQIAIDLKNVTYVDAQGRELLQAMHDAGVVFLHAGMATQDILDELTPRGDSARRL